MPLNKTQRDTIIRLMKDEYTTNKKVEFTSAEIAKDLGLTMAQVSQAVTLLRREKIITNTNRQNDKRNWYYVFALTEILEQETSAKKESELPKQRSGNPASKQTVLDKAATAAMTNLNNDFYRNNWDAVVPPNAPNELKPILHTLKQIMKDVDGQIINLSERVRNNELFATEFSKRFEDFLDDVTRKVDEKVSEGLRILAGKSEQQAIQEEVFNNKLELWGEVIRKLKDGHPDNPANASAVAEEIAKYYASGYRDGFKDGHAAQKDQ